VVKRSFVLPIWVIHLLCYTCDLSFDLKIKIILKLEILDDEYIYKKNGTERVEFSFTHIQFGLSYE